MITRILLSLFIAALFASCASSGRVTNDPDSQWLIFGNGGGFTGMYTNYELHEDGRLYTMLSDSTQHRLKRIRHKQSRDIFAQANKLKMTQAAFNHPGNMTSFIRFKHDGVLTEYKWGDPNVYVPGEIKDLYSKLNAIVK